MEMSKLEKVIIWLKYDYLPRVGAYRKDCKQGCDACMPLHDGDNYCDIDMLCKILALLKEQEAVEPIPFFTETGAESPNYVICGHCKSIKAIMPKYTKQKYCHECGFPVLWGGR